MEIIDKKVRWKGRFMSAVEIRYRDAKGIERSWEAIERVNIGGIVVMVAVTPANTVLLERQFRPPLGRDVLELPAGLVDPGEAMESAARRELIEETGWSARELRFLVEGPMSTPRSSGPISAPVSIMWGNPAVTTTRSSRSSRSPSRESTNTWSMPRPGECSLT
jgi:8-oxo-dGTP pyrophosphatase MutT (NUDIX family)